MRHSPNIPREIGPLVVLIRASLRLVILVAFAALGSLGFAKTFSSLLLFAGVYCAVVAALRGEPVSWHVLTHWDEAAVYLLLGWIAASLA
jgi:hypothetical protein